ncbi:PREDICTED: uncharacterized protein C11orf52 homolog [Chrysochloris asiatica]|uniref:Uncharacterized protein C11orf52 homolog n=1 Tax=Chrysochloris asiatica TaxID=185453 RepID=A0A9B0WFM5_CHRAS|nr:PREDICTED: uncharacterized protein C11orf52 homolog [Chrysochloris asiatica]
MGNRLCCGGSWGCPSTLQRKKKTGSQGRQPFKRLRRRQQPEQQQQHQEWQQLKNNTRDIEAPECTYERVMGQPEPYEKRQACASEENNLHYADILVYSQTQPRTVEEVKSLQLENATEYATLRFPQPNPPFLNNKLNNGKLV